MDSVGLMLIKSKLSNSRISFITPLGFLSFTDNWGNSFKMTSFIDNGRYIVQNRALPETAYWLINDGVPTVIQQWMCDVVNYFAYAMGGYTGIVILGIIFNLTLLGALFLYNRDLLKSNQTGLNAAIFVDGVQCFSMSRYTKQQPKQEFDIDLSGACRLDIKTSNAYESNGKSLYLVETKFEKSGEVLPFTEWYSLRNTVLIDSHSYEATKSLGVDSYGELHNGSLRFDASHDSYALFNLNKQYHSFSASLAPGNDTSSDIKMDITIYCDDNVVFSEQGITRLDPKMAINLDVTDVGVLRVETDAEYDGNYDAYLYIYDDILK